MNTIGTIGDDTTMLRYWARQIKDKAQFEQILADVAHLPLRAAIRATLVPFLKFPVTSPRAD